MVLDHLLHAPPQLGVAAAARSTNCRRSAADSISTAEARIDSIWSATGRTATGPSSGVR